MNKLLLSLQGIKEDSSIKRIFENDVAKKTFTYLSIAFILIAGAIFISFHTLYKYYTPIQRPLLYVDVPKKEINDLITLQYPQQSRESLENWVASVVRDVSSLSFNNLEQNIESHRKYFVDDNSFQVYKKTLQSSGQIDKIKKDSVSISTVLLKTPVQIDVQPRGEVAPGQNIYWTYRVPVLMTYNSGGVRPFTERKNITVILVRVPTYKNHGGFGLIKFG